MKKTILFFSLLTMIGWSSCESPNFNFDKDFDKEFDKDYGKEECFEIVYPITYTMPDGSDISGNGEEEIWTEIKDWYENNPETEEKPTLNYPVDVIYEDGDIESIANEEAMIILKKDCDDYEKDYDKEACFEFAYPVSFTMPDGAVVTGNNEEEVDNEIKDWYVANPTIEEEPALIFPVEILFEGGESQEITNEDELLEAFKECYEKDEWDLESCTWDEAAEASGSQFEKFIVKELEVSDDCGCITDGIEKFTENGQTRFLIYYGEKDCTGYGIKVTCENGNCEEGEKCFFEQDCQP